MDWGSFMCGFVVCLVSPVMDIIAACVLHRLYSKESRKNR